MRPPAQGDEGGVTGSGRAPKKGVTTQMIHENREALDILHVGFGHPPVIGGGPIYYLHHLCKEQNALGMQAACFVAGTAKKQESTDEILLRHEVIDGVAYHIVDRRPAHYFDWANPAREADDKDLERLFVRILEATKPGILHFHNLVGLTMSLVEAAKEFNLPTVFSAHNYWMLCPRDDLFAPNEACCEGPGDGARCASCVGVPDKTEDFMIRAERAREILDHSTDLILAVSHRVKEILARCGVLEEKIEVLKIGSRAAEENWLRLGSARRLDETGPQKVRFGFFGTIMVRKGPHIIIEALEHLQRFRGRFEVVFHGAGLSANYWARMERALARAPLLWDHVRFPGPYTQEDLPELLRQVDVAVIPPIWEDNGPQTVMETLAAGVPVLGSRMGGIPDFVSHGVNGLLFRPNDPMDLARAMARVIEEEGLLPALRAGISPPHGMKRHAEELSEVYGRARNENRRREVARAKTASLLSLASESMKKGEEENTEAYLEKAVEEHPRPVEGHYLYASFLISRGRREKAMDHLLKVVRADARHGDAHNDLGVLFHAGGRLGPALYHLKQAARFSLGAETPLRNLGHVYLQAGKAEEALETYETLLERDPDDREAVEAVVRLRAALGRGESDVPSGPAGQREEKPFAGPAEIPNEPLEEIRPMETAEGA